MSSNSSIYINGVLQQPSTYSSGNITMPNGIKSFTNSLPISNNITVQSYGSGLNSAQLSPLTISSLGSSANSSINWSNLNVVLNPSVKKYEVVETTEDIVALSVAAHRVYNNSKIHHKLLERELFEKVTNDDREHAKVIKDYYSKRVMMLKLKSERKLSPFREDMNKLIHTDGTTFKESMIGVAYWLPEFYKYDTQMDDIKSQVTTNQNFDQLNKSGKPNSLNLSVELIPLKCVQRKTKRSKNFEYWFKDTKVDAAVSIQLEDKNQLKHLWDHLFNTEKVLQIKGNVFRRSLDNFEYFSINSWEIDRG
jgi:hypothetical protein